MSDPRNFRERFALALTVSLMCASAQAQQLLPNGLGGAGNHVRTSVAQPESTSQASGGYVRSVEPSLGPLADPLGLRAFLKPQGVEYSLTYIVDILGNPTGGIRRGAVVEDRLNLRLNLDLEKIAGWEGATIHANAYFIHGTGLSRYYVDNLLTTSSIEALPSSRLYVLWFDQKFFDGKLAIRAGQLAVDTEFFVSQTATVFMNTTFGFPALGFLNLPGGGPIYPLATPAIRARYKPNDNFTFQVGLYDGDPGGASRIGPDAEPQRLNRTGTSFRTNDPALVVAEAVYAYNTDKKAPGLPGTVTLGGWQHFGRFDDFRTDATGRSLADPLSTGVPRQLRGNSGVFGILDQTLYRETGKDDEGLSAFVRAGYSPTSSSLIDMYIDGGLAYKGLFESREDDTLGLSVGYARISRNARRADRNQIFYSGTAMPGRSSEAVYEVTYQVAVVPGVTVQPDFQYIVHPGSGITNPQDISGRRIKNTAIFGIRVAVQY